MTNRPFGFLEHLRHIENRITRAASLVPLPLPRELTVATGSWKGAPAFLTARAYRRGDLWGRVVELTGPGLEIGNLLMVGPAPLPILGMDLIGLGERGTVVADLSPSAPGADRPVSTDELPDRLPVPSWCAAWMSATPLLAHVSPAEALRVGAALAPYVDRFMALLGTTSGANDAYAGYAEAHRRDDRGLSLLGKIFGDPFASRFMDQVMFPTTLFTHRT